MPSDIRGKFRLPDGGEMTLNRDDSWTFGDGVPAGILETDQDITPTTATRYRDDWLAGEGSPVRVLGSGLRFNHLRLNPADASWLESRRFNGEEIARMYLVPAYKLNLAISGGMTYSNSESLERDYIRGAVSSYLLPIEHALNSLTPAGRNASEETVIDFDYRGLLRATTVERFQSYESALRGGWMTPDEVRELEGLPPMTRRPDPAPES